MAPTSRVILCRHSQAEHNVDLDYSIADAPLTALGRKQSAALAPQIPELQEQVDLIISSALKRTLQSTKLGWGPAVQRLGIKNVICLPQAQECNDFPCDTGSPREQLESLEEFKDFNLELLTPDWTSKKGFYAPDPKTIAQRARWIRQYIKDRPEHVIVLVAHGDILRQITGTPAGSSSHHWRNAEVREYKFDTKSLDDQCYLIQEQDIAVAGGYEQTSSEMDIGGNLLSEDIAANMETTMTQPVLSSSTSIEPASISTLESALASTSTLPAVDSTDEGAMLKLEDVAKDSTVFTPEGRIIFHRSDGDPEYRPPNLVVPDPKESEVNYYHIFNRDEQKWVNWSKTIAQKLAGIFGVPGENWALKDFPKDYDMTEQRKGPRRTYRTDPYLFGSAAHRFRSTNEFIPHAVWLLCDPSLDTRNCRCIYCSKGNKGPSRGVGGGYTIQTTSSKRVVKPVNKYQTSQAASYRTHKANYRIRAQISPRGKILPGIPHAIISSTERNNELAAVETKDLGECEGFRVGEIAYCKLKTAIISEEDSNHQISAWPVLIEASRMVVTVEPEASESNGSKSSRQIFSLQGRVKQKRVYDVVFLPTHEKARVEEEQMVPGLMFKMPSNLRKVHLGSREDHEWIQNSKAPELNLQNGKQRPLFRQVLFVFLYAVESFQNLRLLYTVTDQFSRAESGKEAVKHVVFAQTNNDNGDAQKEPQAPWLIGNEATPSIDPQMLNAERRINNGGANRFLQATEQNNYMDLDSDERSNRRRAPFRTATTNTNNAASADAMSTVSVPAALDNNTYWQGLLLGLERIWVGDLARLRLSKEDVEIMMSSLAKGNDVFNAEDRVKPDLTSPYLLRIKAIYRIAKAEVEKTDDKIRVAGDVFRVVPVDKCTTMSPEVQSNGAAKVKKEDQGAQEGKSPSPKKKTKRPTFEIPFRPFLDKAYENQLPMSPMLPEGYGYQRVNQASVEVVCSVQQLAGRLWCSLAHPGDDKLAKIEIKKIYLGHEDNKDSTRIRLSLAAMLPGAVKAMEVHPNEGLFMDRDRSIAQACKLALESRLKALDRLANREGGRSSNNTAEDEEEEEREDENEDQSRHQIEQSIRPTKKAKVDTSINAAAAEDRTNHDTDMNSVLNTIVAHAQSLLAAKTADTPAKASVVMTEANTDSSLSRRETSPPLPEGWIKKASRSGQGTYFANLKTKETSWTHPSA